MILCYLFLKYEGGGQIDPTPEKSTLKNPSIIRITPDENFENQSISSFFIFPFNRRKIWTGKKLSFT